MTNRENTILTMLHHYQAAQEPLQRGGNPGETSEDRVLLMPNTWNASYRELERCLKHMRSQGDQQAVQGHPLRVLYWHVRHYHIEKEPHRQRIVRYEKRAGGRSVKVTLDQFEIVWHRHPDAREDKANLGVGWLAKEFRGEPSLPDEIRDAA